MSELFDPPSRTIAEGVLIYEHSHAPLVLESLRPDNTSDVQMELQESRIIIRVTSQSLRTLIATCDDLLVNLQVATEALADVQA
ncbi:MAG: KEOPS complex subunit Pcc1 [Halobacteriota archaeon]